MYNKENENRLAKKLVYEYSEHGETDFDKLQKLNKKAKRPAQIFSYVFGSISALVFGTGMSLAMKIIGGTTPLMIVGVVVGVVGAALGVANYFIHKKMLKNGKEKYAGQILEISNGLLNK